MKGTRLLQLNNPSHHNIKCLRMLTSIEKKKKKEGNQQI